MVGTAETFIARIQSVKTKFLDKEFEHEESALKETEGDIPEGTRPDKENIGEEQGREQQIDSFVYEILEGKEVNVLDTWQSPVGGAITKLFTDAYKVISF